MAYVVNVLIVVVFDGLFLICGVIILLSSAHTLPFSYCPGHVLGHSLLFVRNLLPCPWHSLPVADMSSHYRSSSASSSIQPL